MNIIVDLFNLIVYIAGLVIVAKLIWTLCSFINIFITTLNNKWAQKYGIGSWCIVTGCTEGIGKGFCFELAKLGFNLVLISRSQEKLQTLNSQLDKQYPNLNTVIIVSDFSKFSHKKFEEISDKVSHLDISFLVNNVGVAISKKFHKKTISDIDSQINININCMTYLTAKILPHMLQRKQRSAIINLSSAAITCPIESLSIYTATKAYNSFFSRGLSAQYSEKIDILSVQPCIVSTAATKFTNDITSCSAEDCARGSLKSLGKVSYTGGHWTHCLQTLLFESLGENIGRWVATRKFSQVQTDKKE